MISNILIFLVDVCLAPTHSVLCTAKPVAAVSVWPAPGDP